MCATFSGATDQMLTFLPRLRAAQYEFESLHSVVSLRNVPKIIRIIQDEKRLSCEVP